MYSIVQYLSLLLRALEPCSQVSFCIFICLFTVCVLCIYSFVRFFIYVNQIHFISFVLGAGFGFRDLLRKVSRLRFVVLHVWAK